ncbi:MAG: type II secretion system protein [bacterium]
MVNPSVKISNIITKDNYFNKRTGLTLIELLVVIAIVGILSTLTIITINSAKAKARDAKRMHDTRQIIIALSMYYQDYGYYPKYTFNCGFLMNFGAECSGADPSNFLKPLQDAGYFAQTPVDPLNNGGYFYYYLSYACELTLGGSSPNYNSNTPTNYVLWWQYEKANRTCDSIIYNLCKVPPNQVDITGWMSHAACNYSQ